MIHKIIVQIEDIELWDELTINDVHFSPREIDLISCIVCGRTSRKTIAATLGISPTTVATYLHTTMQKINCSSWEHIRLFAEKSSYLDFFRLHMNRLERKKQFLAVLLNIKKLIDKPIECTLKFDDLVIEKKSRKILKKLIFFRDDEFKNDIQIASYRKEYDQNSKNICHNLESLVLSIIKALTHQDEIVKLIEFFDKQQLAFEGKQAKPKITESEQKEKKYHHIPLPKISFSILSLILITFVYIWYEKSNIYIRSALNLPPKKYILQRSDIIQAIRNKFQKNKSSIKYLNITGIGGSGKTTVSRLYAKTHKGLVWEFNAETKNSIKEGLKNFAIALVSNHEDKEQWFFINSITREEEKETALLAFIHKKLKLFPGWLLIFDNLDNFKWMKKYIPHDALLCGNGYVLITTRNANNLFGETFKIPDLSEEEVVSLFTKYFSEQSLKTFKKEYDFIAFLKQIPHYPLDVTVASRYLEDSKMGYREYLLKISTNEFEKDQKNLLASEHDYDKTRRDIIRASVEKVISVDDRYISLLYLISMVNSENITRDMLSFFTDQSTSNQFIRELKKYSLITFESMERKEAVFSLHRNIQESIFFEMKNYFDKKNSKQIIHEVVLTTEKYANYLIKLEDYNKMLLLIPHLEFLLKREGLEKDDQNILKAIHCSIIDFLDLEEMHYKTMKSAETVIKDLKNSDPFSLRLSNFLMYYGHLCGWHGEYEKSIRALEESLSIALKLKCSSLEVLTRKSRLATMYRAMSDYKKASILIDDCAHEEKVYGEHYYEQSFFYAVKGLVFRDTGKYLEALTSFEKSVNLLKEHRPNYLKSAQQISWLANFYIQVGLSAKGIELIENNGIDCGYRELVIGLAYVNQRQYTKAYKALSKLMKKAQTTNYVINYNYFKSLLPALGRVYIHFGEYAKAQEILEESLERLNKHYGVGHFQTAVTITYLGEIDLCRDNLPAAEIKMLKAYHLLKKCHHADVHIPLEGLSKLYKIQYERSDKKDEAYSTYYEKSKAYLLEASKIIHDNFPKDSIHIVRIKNELKFFSK